MAAAKIPEEIVEKIMMMTYKLEPHPTAKIVSNRLAELDERHEKALLWFFARGIYEEVFDHDIEKWCWVRRGWDEDEPTLTIEEIAQTERYKSFRYQMKQINSMAELLLLRDSETGERYNPYESLEE